MTTNKHWLLISQLGNGGQSNVCDKLLSFHDTLKGLANTSFSSLPNNTTGTYECSINDDRFTFMLQVKQQNNEPVKEMFSKIATDTENLIHIKDAASDFAITSVLRELATPPFQPKLPIQRKLLGRMWHGTVRFFQFFSDPSSPIKGG